MADSSKLFWYKCLIGAILVGFVKGKTCWDAKWYNSSAPSDHGGSESESQPIDVLNTICPDGSPVIDARCKDEKGEPIKGYKNDVSNKYIANCTVATGLSCHPYADGVCADYSIQYGCACPTTLPTHITARGTMDALKETTTDESTTTGEKFNKHGTNAEGVEKNGRTAAITNPVLVLILITVARIM